MLSTIQYSYLHNILTPSHFYPFKEKANRIFRTFPQVTTTSLECACCKIQIKVVFFSIVQYGFTFLKCYLQINVI